MVKTRYVLAFPESVNAFSHPRGPFKEILEWSTYRLGDVPARPVHQAMTTAVVAVRCFLTSAAVAVRRVLAAAVWADDCCVAVHKATTDGPKTGAGMSGNSRSRKTGNQTSDLFFLFHFPILFRCASISSYDDCHSLTDWLTD